MDCINSIKFSICCIALGIIFLALSTLLFIVSTIEGATKSI
jgi:hypothetical protein